MIKGLQGKPYIDLSHVIDIDSFINLHPEICNSFAIGKEASASGSLDVPDGFMNLEIYNDSFIPLYKAYDTFLNLPDDHPVRINGANLSETELSTYLKFVLGGYDLYSFYVLCDFEEGWRTASSLKGIRPASQYFPGVLKWLESLITSNIFSHIGRATFFVQEAGGISFEHRDPSVDPAHPEIVSEFIHIRPNLNRPFYIRDPDTMEKFYVNSRVGYWNDQDWHGGDTIMEPSYAFRVDGVFTDEFRNRILDDK